MAAGIQRSLAVLAVAAVLTAPAAAAAVPSGPLQIHSGPFVLTVPAGERALWTLSSAAGSDRALRWLEARSVRSGDGVSGRLAWTPDLARIAIAAASSGARAVSVPDAVVRVTLTAPAIRQRYRNDCEVTALAIALRGSQTQDALQHALPPAPPVHARTTPRGLVWGDPQAGFVGDFATDGYGVYDRPLAALAQRFDPGTENLTGRPLATILAALRDGRPVVVWVTLGQSQPFTWRAPSGAVVHADRAEHAVTLTSWSPHLITYTDPWDGTRKLMAAADLAARWLPLGKRAIALSARPVIVG